MGDRAAWRPPLTAEDQETKNARQKTQSGYQQRPPNSDGGSSGDHRRRKNGGEGGRQRRPPHRRQLQDGDPQKSTPKALADPALRSLILTLCKSQLQTQQRTRRLEGALTDTILMPDKHPVAQALRREAINRQTVAARRRGPLAFSAADDAAAGTADGEPVSAPVSEAFEAAVGTAAGAAVGIPGGEVIERLRSASLERRRSVPRARGR